MSRLRASDLQRSRLPAHNMLEVLYSVLLHVWHGTSVYMPFVSFLTVYPSGESEAEKTSLSISLLACLHDSGTNEFYRPLLDGVIEFDEDEG